MTSLATGFALQENETSEATSKKEMSSLDHVNQYNSISSLCRSKIIKPQKLQSKFKEKR